MLLGVIVGGGLGFGAGGSHEPNWILIGSFVLLGAGIGVRVRPTAS
jgi:hypothetical protein